MNKHAIALTLLSGCYFDPFHFHFSWLDRVGDEMSAAKKRGALLAFRESGEISVCNCTISDLGGLGEDQANILTFELSLKTVLRRAHVDQMSLFGSSRHQAKDPAK